MNWIPIALVAPLFFVVFQSLSKLLPRDVSPYLINAYASLIGFLFMLALHFIFAPAKSLTLTSKTLTLALFIGALIALGNMLTIRAYAHGAPQALFTTVFYITLIIFGTLVGVLVWHEKMNLGQIGGILLSILGIVAIFYFKK